MTTKLLTELTTEAHENCAPECEVARAEENACVCENLAEHIEAVLFLNGDGVSVPYLAEKFGVTDVDVNAAIAELTTTYSGMRGIHLLKYRNNYQFATNPAYADRVAEILNPIREKNLTRAALEALAIVAYKHPITRLEVDEIRGVDSTYSIQILSQNNLIQVVGRRDTVGKPLVYATTDEFLKRFELENIDKLPSYDELLDKIKVIQQGDDIYDRG